MWQTFDLLSLLFAAKRIEEIVLSNYFIVEMTAASSCEDINRRLNNAYYQ